MNKKTLITALEGCYVRTGDGHWHQVKDAAFRSADGATCRLKDYARYHLLAFLRGARAEPPGGEVTSGKVKTC